MVCSQCGTEVENETRFCGTCGAPLEGLKKDVIVPEEASVAEDPTVIIPKSASVEKTPLQEGSEGAPQNPPIDKAGAQGAHSSSGDSSSQQKKKPIALIVLVAVVLILIAVIAFLLMKPLGSNSSLEGGEDLTPVEVPIVDESESASQEDLAEKAQKVSEKEQAEAEDGVYATLSQAYDALSDYDNRVQACVADFNNYALLEKHSERTAYADIADELEDELHKELRTLRNNIVSSDSKHKQTYEDVCTLYECLIKRIAAINEGWSLSCRAGLGNNMQKWAEEIFEPVVSDNVDGVNRYKTRYDELYPQAKPKQ